MQHDGKWHREGMDTKEVICFSLPDLQMHKHIIFE